MGGGGAEGQLDYRTVGERYGPAGGQSAGGCSPVAALQGGPGVDRDVANRPRAAKGAPLLLTVAALVIEPVAEPLTSSVPPVTVVVPV